MKGSSVGIDVDIFAARRCRNSGMLKGDIVTDGLARFKCISKTPRLVENKVTACKTCRFYLFIDASHHTAR